ncbi:hypothetical protein CPB86DRAFT_779068 [Serendipita vermifera]|nr:hypothetical protein CPB86DRAFT_779068 [Serendipita vermifera]
MSSEETSFYEREKERLVKEIGKTLEEISLTLNSIIRSQEGTIALAQDKVTGETNMWMHLREVGIAKARERIEELAASTAPAALGAKEGLGSSTGYSGSKENAGHDAEGTSMTQG